MIFLSVFFIYRWVLHTATETVNATGKNVICNLYTSGQVCLCTSLGITNTLSASCIPKLEDTKIHICIYKYVCNEQMFPSKKVTV